MLHSKTQVITADNGVQIFSNEDIENILSMAYDYDYSNDSRKRRYTDNEVCDYFEITQNELNRMRTLLSYESCHDKNGK